MALLDHSTRIAVIGGGSVGTTLANSLVAAKAKVYIGARDPVQTKEKLKTKGFGYLESNVRPVQEAISKANILILAVPGAHTDEGIEAMAKSLVDEENINNDKVLAGKTIIDATNPFTENMEIRWRQGTSSAEVLQKFLPDCKVYKCFNTIGVEWLSKAKEASNLMDMFYCGPDREGIVDIVEAVGFKPRYVGPIRYARNLEAMAELWVHCASEPLEGEQLGRNWGFVIAGKPWG